MHRSVYCRVLLMMLFALLLCTASLAQAQDTAARELVRRAIQNDVRDADGHGAVLYAYKSKLERINRPVTVKQIVETPQGTLGRVVSLNGQPLSLRQAQEEDARVNRLLNPDEMRKKRKSQQEDAARTMKLLRAIPDAFLFTRTGEETGADGHKLLKMHFTPDPNFDPPSRECIILQGMSGDIVVDQTAVHMHRIDGTLFKDVTIGWGIIGRLDKGGRFLAEAGNVNGGHWSITRMTLDFAGRALIFKSIRILETETTWDYRPVEHMSVAQALNYLKAQEAQAAAHKSVAQK